MDSPRNDLAFVVDVLSLALRATPTSGALAAQLDAAIKRIDAALETMEGQSSDG
jgi:hypothetical protein